MWMTVATILFFAGSGFCLIFSFFKAHKNQGSEKKIRDMKRGSNSTHYSW